MPFGGALTLGAVGAVGGLGSSLLNNAAQQRIFNQQNDLRKNAIQQQLELINSQSAPVLHDYTRAYLDQLAKSSNLDQPLATDPFVQGARAQLLGGGARELAGVANQKRAAGISGGGFKNVGSIQDIQDRMSAAMANLAGEAAQGRLQRAGQAADIGQTYADKVTNFENAKKQAAAAAHSGDLGAAIQGLQQQAGLTSQGYGQLGNAFGNLAGLGAGLAQNQQNKQYQSQLLDILKQNKVG